jgi:hypothetical protein
MFTFFLFIYIKGNKNTETITEIEKLPNNQYYDFEKKDIIKK